jgi:cysteine desulfurase family protein (TIGR01976 family)
MKDIAARVRPQFPALATGAVFFDGPGGTQVPQAVIDAVAAYFREANANEHGLFATSRRSDEIVAAGRCAMADFFNARSADEIVFGANMTTLTFHLSRSLGLLLQPGDEIVVTRLDHDANIAPWLFLQEKGAVIRWLEFRPGDCTLDLDGLERLLNKRTRIVAVGHASNAFGTVNDVPRIVAAAQQAGALTFVDAVHFAPHRPIDVQQLGCDFLACSPYKFYGPHSGVLYGRREALERLRAYKVRPAVAAIPDCFETGTKNHEGIAGIAAAVDYLAAIGRDLGPASGFDPYESGRRRWLKQALAAIMEHETRLFARLLDGLLEIPGLRLLGISDPGRLLERTPTACFTLPGLSPARIAEKLGQDGIQVWDGNYYAWEAMNFLGLEAQGGAVRAGLSMYNDEGEVDRFLKALGSIARESR